MHNTFIKFCEEIKIPVIFSLTAIVIMGKP